MSANPANPANPARTYEYTSAADISLGIQPIKVYDASNHETGETRVIPFDLSKELGLPVEVTATSPNLLASFVRICEKETIRTSANATSQVFYVIRGNGKTFSYKKTVEWNKGDLFVVSSEDSQLMHEANEDAAFYWVHDEPLLRYLGVIPTVEHKFELTHFTKEYMMKEIDILLQDEKSVHKNRLGILLGNKATESYTKTLTHTLWGLYNMLPAGVQQRPHRHNSVALDLCVYASRDEKVYTLMGPELDMNGWVKEPIKCIWKSGSVFTTPPGWWHSHHNEGNEDAWVLPIQDAGILTHMRILDIQFSTACTEL